MKGSWADRASERTEVGECGASEAAASARPCPTSGLFPLLCSSAYILPLEYPGTVCICALVPRERINWDLRINWENLYRQVQDF